MTHVQLLPCRAVIYRHLPKITSTAITECMRRDPAIFNNENDDVWSPLLGLGKKLLHNITLSNIFVSILLTKLDR